jgi:hypothetical protein
VSPNVTNVSTIEFLNHRQSEVWKERLVNGCPTQNKFGGKIETFFGFHSSLAASRIVTQANCST